LLHLSAFQGLRNAFASTTFRGAPKKRVPRSDDGVVSNQAKQTEPIIKVNIPRSLPVALILLALFTSPAAARQDEDSEPADFQPAAGLSVLDTITVMGTRKAIAVQDNPVSVSIIDQEEIERQPGESVAELLRDIPGVIIIDTSAPGMKRIRIRGESSRRVTILIDGQELTDHSTGGTPLLVDTANIERIDVLRGPASVLYGAKAIGGVINIITRKGADKPLQLEAGGSWFTGSDGWQAWTALSGTVEDFDYRLGAARNRHKDRRVARGEWSDSRRLDNSSYNNSELSLHMGQKLGEDRNHYLALKANRHRLDTDAWTDPFSFEYPVVDFGIDLPRRDLDKLGLQYDGDYLSPLVHKLHVDAYYQTVDRLFNNHILMQPLPVMQVNVESSSDDRNINYGGTAQIDLNLHPDHYTIFGLYYLMDDLDTVKTTTTSTIMAPRPPSVDFELRADRATARTMSAFVQDEWHLTPALTLSAGMRYYHFEANLTDSSETIRPEQKDRSTGRVVKSAGLTWSLAPESTLRALYAEGYIMPTLLEMFTDNTAGRGVLTYGNPELDPETSRNMELGWRFHGGGFLLDLAAYYTRASSYITTRPCSTSSACPQNPAADSHVYVNADAAKTWGLEFMTEYAFADSPYTAYINGAWARRKLEFAPHPDQEDDLPGYDSRLPALTGRAGLRYEKTLSEKEVWGDLFVRASTHSSESAVTEDQHLLVEETRRLPGWATVNLAGGMALGQDGQYRFGLHLNNLFNRSYRASVDELPAMGRNAVATFRLAF